MNHEKEDVKPDTKCKIGNIKKDFVTYNDENIKLLGYDLTGKTYTNKFLINSTLLVSITAIYIKLIILLN